MISVIVSMLIDCVLLFFRTWTAGRSELQLQNQSQGANFEIFFFGYVDLEVDDVLPRC